MKRCGGFTLVEALLVSSLVAGLSLAVFLSLSSGLKLWDRSRVLVVDEDIAIFFDKFATDVRNSFPFSTLDYSGEETRVAFPAVVTGAADRSGSRAAEMTTDQIGRVQYLFDSGTGRIVRRQANYAQGTRDAWGEERVLVSGVALLMFRYFFPGSSDPRSAISEKTGVPSGIEVEVRFNEGGEERSVRRYVPVPVGQ